QGSAVAITADDRYAVAVNRTAGRVTVFKLDFGGATPATKLVDLDVGKTAEPWAVVIGNDDDSAYVILRKDQQLVRIKHLRSSPPATAARPEHDACYDAGRQGVVYSSHAAGTVGPLITIAPVADTAFLDSKGQKTGCFPNRLSAAAINANRRYVTSVCESPRG